MTIRNLLLMSAALVALSACDKTDENGMDTSMSGMNGTELSGSEMGMAPVNGVMPGTQQDLVVNVGDRVFFGYDQSDLSYEARTTLERQATWMKQYPAVMVTIEGHADERGTREYNLALGERRASSVRSYLMSLGVDANRINTISYGKERPAVPESTAAAWSQNRRGVTVVN
ncbi:MAG TPA: peptidoglycan-associated lipoprotein Pal [Alphaproteobacteria bacterium]|nr:peptidoglycan-associated lipoprotein Pal [Alphaproteobacteria bacterium]HOO50745.1 peptidoglycan-associated lipoprotein Pal [Alphaproteobacteria bacterium]